MAQGCGWTTWRGRALSVGALVVVVAAVAAGVCGARALLPQDGEVAVGLTVDGVAAGPAEPCSSFVAVRAAARLDSAVALTHDGQVVYQGTLRELGGTVDEAGLTRAVTSVGHRGSLWQRLDDARQARRGRVAVRTRITLPIERLVERLSLLKTQLDTRPTPARWDFSKQAAVAHADGRALDVYATAEALVSAVAEPSALVPVVLTRVPPRVTADVVAAVDRSTVVGRYETRFAFWGGQAGRAQNVARAATAVDGAVLMPGEVFSFNAVVGPRSLGNGFAQAGEIYKGEMRLGVGGGTCQVASTLYAVSFFAGLDVLERSPHSRPSGYVPPGLDATVAYPDVDLKLRNPFPFPLVVRADLGQGLLGFELIGRQRLATVELESATIKVSAPARKVREASWLAEGRVVKKQKGTRGLTIAKTRRIRFQDGSERVEQSRDVYPPADEIFLIPVGGDPAVLLPPVEPEGAGDSAPEGAGGPEPETAADGSSGAHGGRPAPRPDARLALTAENPSP